MIDVVLYTRESCSLCEAAKATLETLARDYPYRLREIDITADPVLFEKYRFRIPVFLIHGREIAAPIEHSALIEALSATGAG